jgi:hypothetical protein
MKKHKTQIGMMVDKSKATKRAQDELPSEQYYKIDKNDHPSPPEPPPIRVFFDNVRVDPTGKIPHSIKKIPSKLSITITSIIIPLILLSGLFAFILYNII